MLLTSAKLYDESLSEGRRETNKGINIEANYSILVLPIIRVLMMSAFASGQISHKFINIVQVRSQGSIMQSYPTYSLNTEEVKGRHLCFMHILMHCILVSCIIKRTVVAWKLLTILVIIFPYVTLCQESHSQSYSSKRNHNYIILAFHKCTVFVCGFSP